MAWTMRRSSLPSGPTAIFSVSGWVAIQYAITPTPTQASPAAISMSQVWLIIILSRLGARRGRGWSVMAIP